MKQAPEVTSNDLVQFGFFSSTEEIPANHAQLIRFASDLVMYSVKNNYNPLSDSHVLAVKKAICSQVSYWTETGTTPLNDTIASSYSLGELSVSIDSNLNGQSQGHKKLCSTAEMYLNSEYLLYRGMRHGRI